MKTRPMARTIGFAADDALHRALARAAIRTGRSMSNYTRLALVERLRADGYLKAPGTAEATA